eukprot:400628-Lingulodinium_polyedra.AAC.1
MVQAAAGVPSGWAAQVVADLEWVRALCPERCETLPPVREGLAAWTAFAANRRMRWKALLRQALAH